MNEAVQLQRGVASRVRVGGAIEFVSLVAALPLVFLVSDAWNGDEVYWGGAAGVGWFAVYLAALGAVRLAIATEYLVADESGVRWRTILRARSMPWQDVLGFEIAQMSLFPSPVQSWDVVVIVARSGRRRRVRASLWCGDRKRRRWLDEAVGYWMRATASPAA